MRYIPTAFKVIVNIFFYCVYALIGMTIANFTIFGLIGTYILGKPLPSRDDPVHLKLAIVIFILVLLLTFFFRKYFYISVFGNNKAITTELPKNYIKKEVMQEPIIVKKAERIILNEDEIEIFIDKEIK